MDVMTDQSPLIVPMAVEALVVNDTTGPAAFANSGMNYEGMFNVLANAQSGIAANPISNEQAWYGVYLKWRLPAAFTAGAQDSSSGVTNFPLVPNRWLIVRRATNGTTAWIVESDTLNETSPKDGISQAGSAYVKGSEHGPQAIAIGQNFPAAGWSEPGTSLELTAVAPGNHAFAYFQPSCNNVFSFVDQQPVKSASYMVAGWFSDAAHDPLAHAATDFPKVIGKLGWLVGDADSGSIATSSLLYGFVDGVSFPGTGSAMPGSDDVSVAIGNTSVEALTALLSQSAGTASLDAQLLEALQLDLVEILDQPDGEAQLAEALQASFFKRYSGGYSWTIVSAPQTDPPTSGELQKESAILTTLNAAQQQLDGELLQLDALRQQLYGMWWKYMLLSDFPNANGIVTIEEVRNQIKSLAAQIVTLMTAVTSSTVPSGKTSKALQAAIAAYAADQGLPATRLLKRSTAPSYYEINNPVVLVSGAGSNNIGRTPSTVPCRFTSDLIPSFTCGSATFANVPPLSLGVTGAPSWWTSTIESLNVEFFLLDPNSAATIGAALDQPASAIGTAITQQLPANYPAGTLPAAVAQQQWSGNPWHPLFLSWKASYNPTGSESWTFQDGAYAWNGGGIDNASEALGPNGLIILTPTAAFNMQARISAFITNNNPPPEQKAALQALLQDGTWDLLSQSLDGFNEQLCLGQPGAFLKPSLPFKITPSLKDLLDGTGSYPPNIGQVPSQAGASSFQPWRAGQLTITSLTIIDEWGQALPLLVDDDSEVFVPDEFQQVCTSNDALVDPESGSTFINPTANSALTITSLTFSNPTLTMNVKGLGGFVADNISVSWNGALVASANVTIDGTQITATVATEGISGLVQVSVSAAAPEKLSLMLPPALLQPGQLDFSPVSATGGTNASPICGWIVPNILDNAILAFDSEGHPIGEMSIDISTADQPTITWTSAPFSPYAGMLLPQIAPLIPHFGDFLNTLNQQTADEFTNVLQVIDDTLWTTLPANASFDDNLALFVGRPLAMVRASLQFLLDGAPYGDPSWQYTLDPATPAVTSIPFGIQLGDVAQLEDGLIGYFTGDTYSTFNVVQQSSATNDGYLKLIGLGNYLSQCFDGTTVTYLSMLVDPRAAVHATTGILPAVTLTLPQQLVSNALANMSMTFRIDGILTDTNAKNAVLMPARRMPGMTWNWLENDEGTWQPYAIAPNDANARLSPTPPVLRSGLLQLRRAQ
jgi:hypothetical protein